MKKWVVIVVLGALICTSGCSMRTEYGSCIGVIDDPAPHLEYHISVWNVFLAAVFSETFVIPAYIVLADIKCPTGQKP